MSDYRWSADGRRIVFLSPEPRDEELQEEWERGADAVFVDEGPNGMRAGRWLNLWLFDVVRKTETRLTREELLIDELELSPDGKRVVFSARPDSRTNHPQLSELYLLEVRDRRLVRLTNNAAPEWEPRWAPDGRSFAYHSPHAETYDLRNGFLRIMSPDSGERRKLEGQNQGEIDRLTWMPDGKSLLFSEVRRTNTNLYRLDLATGEVTAMTRAEGTLKPLAFSRDRARMVYSFDDFVTPPDLYVSDLRASNPVRLTRSNPWIGDEILLGKGEILRWSSKDGMEIEGVLVVPGTAHLSPFGGTRREGEKIPVMLNIQGGPGGYWGNHFEPDFHVFAGLGYSSLGPNIRGCSGYGDDLLRALMGDVGGGELDDLMSGLDHLIERGLADPRRLAVRGWSWGGVLGAWAITHTDRFKAAALGAMVGDWTSETGPGLMWDLREHYIGSNHWDDPDEWRKRSALTYVGRVRTPTILLHGERDTVSTVNQSMAFFTALKDRGVPARFILFPRQGHDVEEPRLLRICKIEEIRWLQKYVLRKDWQPWKRGE
ncbi:MAG: S9 family peptidase [bacterium]|nr:S9 family peptidase [bacterium]